MATTAQQILDAAYPKSIKNRPGVIATEATELLPMVYRAMQGIFAVAARVNPIYFGKTSDVTLAAGAWARPSDAESIVRLEGLGALTTPNITGEIVVVPWDDRSAEAGKPAVYEFAQKFYTAGNSGDPTAGQIRFFYSKRPDALPTLATTLDAMWPETFNELLILEVAIYLALKDGRGDEVVALRSDRDRWAQQFLAFMEHATANQRRRYGHIRRINTETLVPIGSLLAGGSSLAVGNA